MKRGLDKVEAVLSCVHSFSFRRRLVGQNAWALGKIESTELSDEHCHLCEEFYGESMLTVPTFKRLQKDGEMFHCMEYTKVTEQNSYTIKDSSGSYGQIVIFTLRNNQPAAIIQDLTPLPIPQLFSPTQNIVPVEVSATKKIIAIAR